MAERGRSTLRRATSAEGGPHRSSVDGLDRFRSTYAIGDRGVLDQIELEVCGAVYRANGYTTREQAAELGRRLELGPGRCLLDIGTGCGWPAIFLASNTGCRAVATDVPFEGLVHAIRRARADGVGHRVGVVASAAQAPPFRHGTFDAVIHTDVLC